MGARMRKFMRCVPCVAFLLAIACAAASVNAGPGPLSSISADGLFGIIGAVLFSLLAGYAKGQERRITGLEHEWKQMQSQIGMLREGLHERHPSRPEFTDLRDDMRRRFDNLEQLLREARQ